jgi:hypothetical protein
VAADQQLLEPVVGPPTAEDAPDLVEIVRQELVGEAQRQWFAEIKLPFVGDRDATFVLLEVLRQLLQIVKAFGPQVDLAGLLAYKGLMLARASETGIISPHERKHIV